MAEVPMNPERGLTTYNNSFAAKSSLTQQQKEEENRPKLQATIQGGVTVKRKTPGQRFSETFLNNGDIQTVGQTILWDVVIPAFKEMIFNSVRDGFSMLLWGDTRASRTGGLRSAGGIVRDYSSYSSSIVSRNRDRDRVDIVRPEDSPRYNNLVFTVRGDAENILFNMRDYINTYNDIQIIKLYELVEEQTGIKIAMTAQDAKFGWTDLTNAGIRQIRGGYLLDLPNPIVLEH